jgi:uncharacterized membrane protein YhaH (DUF805 family)
VRAAAAIIEAVTFSPTEVCAILLFATAKRAHDVGWSGHVAWLTLVPYVGGLLFFYLVMRKPQEGANKYGPRPEPESSELDAYR